MSSKISWTDETINPVVGCSKISAGCQNCYAENMARRLAAMGLPQYQNVVCPGSWSAIQPPITHKHLAGTWNGHTAFVESELWKPHKWKKPKTIFISSMGDLFHEWVNIKWQLDILDMVYGCPQHTFIMLTKRPSNMKLVIDAYAKKNGILPNLVLGVSVENQATANERIPMLLKIPAAKRFISLEPMLGPVDLMNLSGPGNCRYQVLTPILRDDDGARQALDCVIIGGESGPKARPLDPAWVRLVRDQCAAAGVSFFFKQWGEWLPVEGVDHPVYAKKHQFANGQHYYKVGTKAAGNLLDGRTHTELAWEVRK